MKRHNDFAKRENYKDQLNAIGFNYHDLPSGPEQADYYQEGVVYALSEKEVDIIQEGSQELHNMTIEMCSEMIRRGDYPEYFALDQLSIPLIEQSWKRNDPSLYGRFDLVLGRDNSLKMLEYNGDTPVSILECSVAQWNYIEQLKTLPERFRHINGTTDLPKELNIQYNLIDETLIETWQKNFSKDELIHFAASGGFRHEDWGNLIYILDTALRAGMKVKEIQMQDIGLKTEKLSNFNHKSFVDLQNKEMRNVFKLYPWEWMTEEKFGKDIIDTNTRWLEPAWKMLLSNKAMLIKLWEMFPNHPLLLESHAVAPSNGDWCKKAIHGREGSNINKFIAKDGNVLEDNLAQGSHKVPEYDHWGYMYQAWHDLPVYDGYRPIIGSWIIGDKACGMSIREDRNLVTGHDAFFASHLFVPYELEEKYEELWK